MDNQVDAKDRIIDLKSQNATINHTWMALALAGGILGVVVQAKRNKGFWGKVGGYIVGSAVISIPVGIVATQKINKNKAEIAKLENDNSNTV